MVLIHHYLWFSYFSEAQNRAYANLTHIYDPVDTPSFSQVASYFGLCVWLVPFALFVSLSAGDNVLPTIGSETPATSEGAKRQGMIKTIVDSVLDGIAEVTRMFGPTQGVRRHRDDWRQDRWKDKEEMNLDSGSSMLFLSSCIKLNLTDPHRIPEFTGPWSYSRKELGFVPRDNAQAYHPYTGCLSGEVECYLWIIFFSSHPARQMVSRCIFSLRTPLLQWCFIFA